MKVKGAIIFILILLLLIGIFVGVPYFLERMKSINFTGMFPLKGAPAGNYYSSGNQTVGTSSATPIIKLGESIYKGKVSISGVSRYNPEQINLSAVYSESGSIDITGWKIKSSQRGEIVIGRGLALPQFNSFSSDIRLKSGDPAEIIAGISPLLSSFQINSCFGWLNNVYNIDSSLNYCPLVQISNLAGFGLDSACQNLILNSGSCRQPSDTILNNYSRECRIWIEYNLNYNACVEKHMNESDFYKGWQIYTGNNNLFFDQLHDRVELRDQAGLLVDSYEY